MALFLIRNLCRADLSPAEYSGQIPISEETGEFFGARVWVPKAVSGWSWVGCIVERECEIFERFGLIVERKVMMTRVQGKAS